MKNGYQKFALALNFWSLEIAKHPFFLKIFSKVIL